MIEQLTKREKEVAVLAAAGMSNREVGAHIGIKESTVKQYLHQVYGKEGIGSRFQLAARHMEPLK